VPTISDLKDQARALEQQGQIDKALNIYQHILKHLEGNPAIIKVLPLYVKAGDLLLKMDRTEEAVASYQTGAEHYASTGAATRVTALCEKILRLAPERTDVYTSFVRLLIQNGHIGSARDVLAEYAQIADMDRALETLNDLAGRPNHEVQPMLERLLESFELEEHDEQAAERVSTHLEQLTDDLAGELSGVPEAGPEEQETAEEPQEETPEETDADVEEKEEPAPEQEVAESDPLAPHFLDLDSMPRKSTLLQGISDDDLGEAGKEEEQAPEIEQSPEAEITTDVTPTMETPSMVGEESGAPPQDDSFGPETPPQEPASEDGGMDLLLAESVTAEEADEVAEATDSEAVPEQGVEIERSEWTPDFAEPSAEETVAAEWSPEEELQPAARYPSDEYDTPEGIEDQADGETAAADRAAADALDDEITRAVEESAAFAATAEEPEDSPEADDAIATASEETEPPAEAEPEPELERRPSPPPLVVVPEDSDSKTNQPVIYGAGGFVAGLVVGAGLTLVLAGGGSDAPPPEAIEDQPAAMADVATTPPPPPVVTPAVSDTQEVDATLAAPESAVLDTAAIETPADSIADSADTTQAEEIPAAATEEVAVDTAVTDTTADLPTEISASSSNPVIVEGMEIDEFSEVESGGRAGFRVVHLLDWADPLVIEAYPDPAVTTSTFIQVNVTPPDTVVGIRRLDGYMVYASSVMPEDSLRSLMSRLVEGERPPN
jgi:hypothetical protein